MSAAKAVGIVLVTIGHAEPVGSTFPALWKVIYSFHMPLFFFLTGIFSNGLDELTLSKYGEYARKQFKTLFVPYVFVSFAYAAIKLAAPGAAKRPVRPDELLTDIFIYPGSAPALFLWFIFTLLIIRLSWPVLSRLPRWLLLLALVPFQVSNIEIPVFLLGYVFYFLIFYVLGAMVASRLDALRRALARPVFAGLALAIFIGGNIQAAYHDPIPALRFPVAVAGVWLVLAICRWAEARMDGPVVATLDRQSFDIYLLQYFFIFPILFVCRRLGLPDELTVMINIVAGILGPLLLVRVGASRMPRLTATLLGTRRSA